MTKKRLIAPDLFADLRALLREFDEQSDKMLAHPQAGALCGLIEKLQQWACRASEHDWYYDQCGYWQHQYCIECRAAKYPALARQKCGELTAKMGNMSESEFLSGLLPGAAAADI